MTTKKKKVKAKARTPELPGMPPKGELSDLCENYVEHKGNVETEKANMETLSLRISELMLKEGLQTMAVHVEGERWNFKCGQKVTKLKVSKSREPEAVPAEKE